MTEINRLSAASSLSNADQVPIWQSDNGDARKSSLSLLKAFINADITASDDKVTQYASPSSTGFSVTLADNSYSKWLILTPTATFADGTLVLPAFANCVDRQEILVNTTQEVTTLTITPNGSTVTGAPTTLAANAYFRLRFDAVNSTWYRVG